MIRRLAVLLYLVMVTLLATGIGIVGEAVSDYGVTIEERQSQTKHRVRQIITNRQERIEQERQQAAESAQIAHRWQNYAVQLERYIERQGLSVPKPTVPLREPPMVQAETPPPVPVETPEPPVPPLPELTPEPPPFIPPPPEPLPPVECVDLPPPVPDFCVEIPPTPNPNP